MAQGPEQGPEQGPDDPIAAQYNRWTFPEPIGDLTRHDARQGIDPALHHWLYWPDRERPHRLDILVAGCGTNQAAELAYHNPEATVLGIDVSAASLAHERTLKDRHRLANLELRLLPIEQVGTLERDFDLIVSTGVLHHLVDPAVGLRALGACLRRDGVVALMLYARYGRFGIDLMRTFAQLLGLGQNAASLALLKETLGVLAPSHPATLARRGDRNAGSDAGLVDLFLNARERTYTARDCLELVESAGLTFQRWFWNQQFYPEANFAIDSQVYRALAALDRTAMWSAMECITKPLDGRHGFIACRRDRPRETWEIDFAASGCLDYVPLFATDVTTEAAGGGAVVIRRQLASARLDANQVALVRRIDGVRSIREIAAVVTPAEARPHLPAVEAMARDLFQRLWALDIIHVRLRLGPAA